MAAARREAMLVCRHSWTSSILNGDHESFASLYSITRWRYVRILWLSGYLGTWSFGRHSARHPGTCSWAPLFLLSNERQILPNAC